MKRNSDRRLGYDPKLKRFTAEKFQEQARKALAGKLKIKVTRKSNG